MTFSYSEYLEECLVFPAILTVLFLLLFGACVYALFQAKRATKDRKLQIGASVVMLVLVLGLVLSQIYQIHNGGLQLLKESEGDAVVLRGVVQDIRVTEEASVIGWLAARTALGSRFMTAYEFQVDGMVCRAPRCGNLQVGDTVSIRYLPHSGFVLYLEQISTAQG